MPKLKFELDAEMVAVIGKALGGAPHDMVRPIIEEMQRQINEQQPQNGQDQGAEMPKGERPRRAAN